MIEVRSNIVTQRQRATVTLI